MSSQQARGHALSEEREVPLLNALPYAALALSTALAVGIDGGSTDKALTDLGLAGLAAAWMLGMFTLNPARGPDRAARVAGAPDSEQRSPRVMGVFFVGLTALMAAMVIANPVFGFFSWTGYMWSSWVLRGHWQAVGFAATALISATSNAGGLPNGSASSWIAWSALVAINVLLAGSVGLFLRVREQDNIRRKEAIAELSETNAKLEASLRENAGLHAQLLAQAREAGTLDERQRMAREIHDTLAQGLVGIITQLEAAAQAPRSGRDWRRHADLARELARESLAEARRSVQALRPVPLDQAHLPDALAAVTQKWSALSGVEAAVTTTGQARTLHPEVEAALLRTAQEALANVARHAAATCARVTLSYMEDVVSLDVCDDGVGFAEAPASTPGGGFGLTTMRERVQGHAGKLEIESEPGAGTTVSASIPLIPVPAGG